MKAYIVFFIEGQPDYDMWSWHDDISTVGVFTSRAKAEKAIRRLINEGLTWTGPNAEGFNASFAYRNARREDFTIEIVDLNVILDKFRS